jgi:hypothetical protein
MAVGGTLLQQQQKKGSGFQIVPALEDAGDEFGCLQSGNDVSACCIKMIIENEELNMLQNTRGIQQAVTRPPAAKLMKENDCKTFCQKTRNEKEGEY